MTRRRILRALVMAAVALLVTLGMQPAAHAADDEVFTVWDGSSYEYYKTCSATPPYPCSTNPQTMYVQITDSSPKSFAITLGYRIEDITTTAGQDYTLATTGTVVIPANQNVTGLFVPLVADGVAEPSETFRVHLTSSSVGGNISDTGIGTIWNDGLIPGDCSLSRSSLYTVAMSCSGRPPTQQWRSIGNCGEEWPHVTSVLGPIVTGNGTSSTTCPSYVWQSSTFHIV